MRIEWLPNDSNKSAIRASGIMTSARCLTRSACSNHFPLIIGAAPWKCPLCADECLLAGYLEGCRESSKWSPRFAGHESCQNGNLLRKECKELIILTLQKSNIQCNIRSYFTKLFCFGELSGSPTTTEVGVLEFRVGLVLPYSNLLLDLLGLNSIIFMNRVRLMNRSK